MSTPNRRPPPLRLPGRSALTAARTAPYYGELPPQPLDPDYDAAVKYLAAVVVILNRDAALRRTDPGKLTRNQRQNLLRIERRWRRRCDGLDRRWTMAGSAPGRLPRPKEKTLRPSVIDID